MCGRYALGDPKEVRERYRTTNNLIGWEGNFNISPGTINPVIVANSPKYVVLMKWGLVPFWAKDSKIGFRMINARSEGIGTKPSFKKLIRLQRCLIPANGFYEWKELKLEKKVEKHPFYISIKNQKIFSMAGVYDIWKDVEGRKIYTYAIITTTANSMMNPIHDRMPVIIPVNYEDKYLDNQTSIENIEKMLVPFDSSLMQFWPVSKEINNPRNNN